MLVANIYCNRGPLHTAIGGMVVLWGHGVLHLNQDFNHQITIIGPNGAHRFLVAPLRELICWNIEQRSRLTDMLRLT